MVQRRRRLERRGPRPRPDFLVLFALIVAAAAPAVAQANPSILLELSTPAECPDRDAIVSAVEKLVHEPPKEPLRASARLEQRAVGYRLELLLGDGRRTVDGTSCVELSQTLVVILALAIDPKADTGGSMAFSNSAGNAPVTALGDTTAPGAELPREPPPELSPPTSARPPERDRRIPARREVAAREASGERAAWRLGVLLLALGDTSMLPSPAVGSTLLVRARESAFAAELAASILAPRWAQAPAASTRKGGDVWWFGGQAGGCWYPGASAAPGANERVELAACLGVEAGELIGEGDGVETRRTARAFWLAAVPGAAFAWRMSSRFALEARLGLAIPALRPEFGLDGYGRFYQPGVVSGRGALGIAFE